MFVCVYLYLYKHSAGAQEGQKKAMDTLDLELQLTDIYLLLVLGATQVACNSSKQF